MSIEPRVRDFMYVPVSEGHQRRLLFADIMQCVLEEFGITEEQLKGARRLRRLAQARKVLWFIAREMTPYSLPNLGHMTGGRDHTTVLNGVQTLHLDLKRFPCFREKFESTFARVRML